jgi:hypothetical protein
VVAVGAGAGGAPEVKVYDSATGALMMDFLAYDPHFTGGVRVALGDVTGDGIPDIITAPGRGGGPDIHVYDGKSGALIRQFWAFDPHFTGGCYVAAGAVNGAGLADIVVGAGPGGGPHVRVFGGADGSVRDSFMAYAIGFTGGVSVAAGDVTGAGRADIITGAGRGGGPEVKVFRGGDDALVDDFMAYDPRFTGGAYVAAVAPHQYVGRS